MATRSSSTNLTATSHRGPPTSPATVTAPMSSAVMSEPVGRSRGSHKRIKKPLIESDAEDEGMMPLPEREVATTSTAIYNMDTDISLLEAPTFTTLDRGPSQPMMNLVWDHKLNLLGKKVVNPMIHCCDKCLKPILIYGRMIPCKHVFCLVCAQASEKAACSRCGDKVARVEQAGLGSIYMCSHGGSRYGNNGCRRTYLSQRDLQAHIQHRHMKSSASAATSAVPSAAAGSAAALLPQLPSAAAIAEATAALVSARNKQGARTSTGYEEYASKRPHFGSPPPAIRGSAGSYHSNSIPAPPIGGFASGVVGGGTHISVMSGATAPSRQSNLITVPIHDPSGAGSAPEMGSRGEYPTGSYGSNAGSAYYGQQQQPPPGGRGFAQFNHPPPNYYASQAGVPSASGYQTYGQHYEGSGGSQYQNSPASAQWRTPAATAPPGQAASYYRR